MPDGRGMGGYARAEVADVSRPRRRPELDRTAARCTDMDGARTSTRAVLALLGTLCALVGIALASVPIGGVTAGGTHRAAALHHHALVTVDHATAPRVDHVAVGAVTAPEPRRGAGHVVQDASDTSLVSAAVPALRTRGPPSGVR